MTLNLIIFAFLLIVSWMLISPIKAIIISAIGTFLLEIICRHLIKHAIQEALENYTEQTLNPLLNEHFNHLLQQTYNFDRDMRHQIYRCFADKNKTLNLTEHQNEWAIQSRKYSSFSGDKKYYFKGKRCIEQPKSTDFSYHPIKYWYSEMQKAAE